MNTIKLDENWNVAVVNGKFVLLEDSEALKQYIKQRLLLVMGEYFLDVTRGVDYEQTLGSKSKPDDSVFVDVINGTGYGVIVVEFEQTFNIISSILNITFSVTSDFGVIKNIVIGV